MERIIYNKTLDVHKNGIQFTLQGFETADKLSRQIVISLMASGDAVDFPLEQIMALMYVKTPSSEEQSIIECEIKDNTIIYDVLPIVEEGITEMQLKIIETRPDGAKSVLATPKFAIEVLKSNADDESVQQKPEFTALEMYATLAKEAYDRQFDRMELSEDCMFRAYYVDGRVYETDVLKRLFNNGNVLLSQSFAKGGSGVRQGEDTDNSMYYSNVSKSASLESKAMKEATEDILADVQKHGLYTAFSVDFATGEVEYVSPMHDFKVNEETGELDVTGKAYTFEDTVGNVALAWIKDEKGLDIEGAIALAANVATLQNTTTTHTDQILSLDKRDGDNKTRLSAIESKHTWTTVGSATYTIPSIEPMNNEAIELKIALPEDFDVTSYSKCRYVVKEGSEITVQWLGESGWNNDVFTKSMLTISSGTGNTLCVCGVGNLDFDDEPKGQIEKNFGFTQDKVVAEDNIVTKFVNNKYECNGINKIMLYAFSGTAGAASSRMGCVWGNITIELQVRK